MKIQLIDSLSESQRKARSQFLYSLDRCIKTIDPGDKNQTSKAVPAKYTPPLSPVVPVTFTQNVEFYF